MSWHAADDPRAGDPVSCDALEMVVVSPPRRIWAASRCAARCRARAGGSSARSSSSINGPLDLKPGTGVDVRPHPHIGLSTLTYLFEGAMMHRDSLGVVQKIVPGEVNFMMAGRGIVHSERSPPEERPDGPRLFGLQAWVASPSDREGGRAPLRPSRRRGAAGDPRRGCARPRRRRSLRRRDRAARNAVADAVRRRGAGAGCGGAARRRALRGARVLRAVRRDRGHRPELRTGPAADLPPRRPDSVSRRPAKPESRSSAATALDGEALHLVELSFVAARAHRTGQGRLGGGPLEGVPGESEFIPLPQG